jgi:hypothetical protein
MQRRSFAESVKAAGNVPEARKNVDDACTRALEALRERCPDK